MPTPEELEALQEANDAEYIRVTAQSYAVVCTKMRTVVRTVADNTVVTLPLASENEGKHVTVCNEALDGSAKLSVSPQATDRIIGSMDGQTATGTVDKDWINPKATQKEGDYATFESDGADWVLVWNAGGAGGYGIWGSEA